MAIYLDAEPLFDMSPNSLALSSLRILAREHGLEIAIPEVAVSEAVAKRREQLVAKISAIDGALEKARGFFEAPDFRKPQVDELLGTYRRELLSGMRLIPIAAEHSSEAIM